MILNIFQCIKKLLSVSIGQNWMSNLKNKQICPVCWKIFADSERVFIGLCLVSVAGDGRMCPPGQEWKQCVMGAVSCTDLTMDVSRNCTPGCQCPRGTVQQVGGVAEHKQTYTHTHTHNTVITAILLMVLHISRMVCVCGSLTVAVMWMESSTNQETLCQQTVTTGK